MARSPCPSCASAEVYERRGVPTPVGVDARLLPGLGTLMAPAHVDIVACSACGLVRWFLDKEALRNVRDAKGWKALPSSDVSS